MYKTFIFHGAEDKRVREYLHITRFQRNIETNAYGFERNSYQITLWNDCGYTIMSRKIVEFHITKWFHTMGHPNMVVFPLISIGIRKVFFGKSIERPQPSHWEGSTSHLHQLWHLYKYEGWESFWTFIKSRTYWSSCRWFGHLRKFHK